MAKDYRYERGLVGKWNGTEVWIMEAKDYDPYPNCISVIADEGMKMVRNGMVVGVLNANGNVNQFDKNVQYPYKKPTPKPQVVYKEEKVSLPVAAQEVELTATIPQGYFDQFTFNVDEFFATLEKE